MSDEESDTGETETTWDDTTERTSDNGISVSTTQDTEFETVTERTDSGTDLTSTRTPSTKSEPQETERKYLLPEDILCQKGRHIKSEDPNWCRCPVPNLRDIIVDGSQSVRGPELASLIKSATEEQKRRMIDLLPLDIPVKYILPNLEEGPYWKRQCLLKWPAYDVWRFDDKWKAMFVEKSVQELIENFIPDQSDISELEKHLKTFSDYVYRLKITKLNKIPESILNVDLFPENFDELLDDFVAAPERPIYLNLDLVLGSLHQLREFTFILPPKSLDFETLQLSIADFNSLLRGLRKLQKLEKFRCSNGFVPNFQIEILCKLFVDHTCMKEINLSYNFVNDAMCQWIGKILISKCPLETLILKYNSITDEGLKAIASGLSENTTLKKLDLSLNLIGDKGGIFLAKVIENNSTIDDLDISKNKVRSGTGLAFADVVKISKSLRNLNIAENYLSPEVGPAFSQAMDVNQTILQLDIRFCGFRAADEDLIHKALIRNRSNLGYISYVGDKKNVTAAEYIV
ncbi:dynein regulatory complex subunit 5-like [Stegodyphus dumicola]|uniref:dynein regulatory complex subunit 5-like n=1 Tax=Stegodyphus dumicola TaxID=202533 RepID=UPI0015AA8FCA|nr:dynein regulatory complex subunit 5-like [Stegodyphus dumicola]